jgi:transcriptional regulator with XRE-family HTH domain
MTEKLSELVRRVRSDNEWTLVDVSRQSGGEISDGYVSRIENGVILNVTPKKLVALARGLRLSEDVVFAAARGRGVSEAEGNEIQLLTYFRNLPSNYQEDLLKIGRLFHREHGVKPAQRIETAAAKRKQAA